jgi:hypothetical protein
MMGKTGITNNFINAMNSISVDISKNLSIMPEWKDIQTFADIGGNNGFTAQRICKAFDNLKATVCDL